MQGQLQKKYLSVMIETKCGHSGQAMQLTIDSDMRVIQAESPDPLVFIPDIDWQAFTAPNIIDAY